MTPWWSLPKSHGLRVTGEAGTGMEVQVTAPVANVEAAFHLNMRTYQHPFEARAFYGPDRDPTVGLPVKIVARLRSGQFFDPAPVVRVKK